MYDTPVNIYALYKPVLLYSHITVNYRYGTILFLFKVSLIFYLQYWQTMHWCKSSEKPNKFVKYFFNSFFKNKWILVYLRMSVFTCICTVLGSSPCNPNPCQGSGICQTTDYITYSCVCITGWEGKTCETKGIKLFLLFLLKC